MSFRWLLLISRLMQVHDRVLADLEVPGETGRTSQPGTTWIFLKIIFSEQPEGKQPINLGHIIYFFMKSLLFLATHGRPIYLIGDQSETNIPHRRPIRDQYTSSETNQRPIYLIETGFRLRGIRSLMSLRYVLNRIPIDLRQ